jgi:hypothetical protein
MITELPLGYQIKKNGFVFTLREVYMSVHNMDGDIMAIMHVLDGNGHRIVRTEDEFQMEVDWWLNENGRN